jgi:hypothetical protein
VSASDPRPPGPVHGDRGLACRADDPEAPVELTFYPSRSRNPTTEWITVDRETAVPASEWD